jgi:glycogen(starch) synthase
MRVLMLSWEYPPNVVGGLGKHVAELVPALGDRGMQIHVVTPLRGGQQEPEASHGVVIHRVMVPSGTFPHFYAEAAQANLSLQKAGEEIVDAEGPFDLVHTHDWLTASAAIGLKHRFKLPLLATIHATERGRGRGVLQGEQAQRINDAEWWLTYEAWRVVCCAQFMADEVHGYFGTPTDKIDVIPNGVDASPFQALDSASLQEFRLRYALPWEKIIMHVGRIVYEKGVDVLIRSVPQILAEAPEAKFVIAGRGPELDHLRQRVREMNLEQKVLLTGFISDEDRNKLYKVADVAVFPSLYEPFGIVALEAMAARTPVVVSAVGGLVEVVRHAETGITIHPGDPASCAWGILHTLQNPEWTTARVENAYREALTTFNWDTIAEQTNVVYTRVLEERARVNW